MALHADTTFSTFSSSFKYKLNKSMFDIDIMTPLLFYPVLEFVVSDFLSNKALWLPDFLYKTFEDLVDKAALIKSLKEPEVFFSINY
jgi:hypothetical protein